MKASGGVSVTAGRYDVDFGQGFYTTTILRQAKQWAWYRYYGPNVTRANNQPVVLQFDIGRNVLASMSSLAFVEGADWNIDYWSFVQHCRQSTSPAALTHARSNGMAYDVVSGPVAAFWTQRVAMNDADQFSFHTTAAANQLNQAMIASTFRVLTIP